MNYVTSCNLAACQNVCRWFLPVAADLRDVKIPGNESEEVGRTLWFLEGEKNGIFEVLLQLLFYRVSERIQSLAQECAVWFIFFNKNCVYRDAQMADGGAWVCSHPKTWPEPELPGEGVCRWLEFWVSFGLKRSGSGAEQASRFILFCLLESWA